MNDFILTVIESNGMHHAPKFQIIGRIIPNPSSNPNPNPRPNINGGHAPL